VSARCRTEKRKPIRVAQNLRPRVCGHQYLGTGQTDSRRRQFHFQKSASLGRRYAGRTEILSGESCVRRALQQLTGTGNDALAVGSSDRQLCAHCGPSRAAASGQGKVRTILATNHGEVSRVQMPCYAACSLFQRATASGNGGDCSRKPTSATTSSGAIL